VPVGLGLGAAAAALLDEPLVPAAVAVTILSIGYDMAQPLFAAIVTSLGRRRPRQPMGLDVFSLFTGFGFGSLVFGKRTPPGFRDRARGLRRAGGGCGRGLWKP
jgi:uncharacterized membrane protein YfcA